MPVSRLRFESLPHAIFLQRASGRDSAAGLEARLGQGAFLALRLVDLLAPDPAPVSEDSFHYQWIATDRFCRELSATAAEGAHIHAIAQSASEARRLDDAGRVAPSLFAYAHFLETEHVLIKIHRPLQIVQPIARVQQFANFHECQRSVGKVSQ